MYNSTVICNCLSVQSINCSLQAIQAFAYSFLTMCADEIYKSCLHDAANIIRHLGQKFQEKNKNKLVWTPNSASSRNSDAQTPSFSSSSSQIKTSRVVPVHQRKEQQQEGRR
jgi:hypothetical protein